MITKSVFPYEFLARWSRVDGTLQGYHGKLATVIFEDDVEISRTESDAMGAAALDAAGFTLSDLLDAVHVSALAERDAAIEAKQQAEAERDAAVKAKEQAEAIAADALAAAEKAVAVDPVV